MQRRGRRPWRQLLLLALAFLAEGDARKTAKVATGKPGAVELNPLSLFSTGAASGGMHGMNLQLIESSLLAMAKDGATPELLPFVDEIMNLTLDMMVEVEKQANASQKSLDDAWNAFLNCSDHYRDAFYDLSEENKSHIECSVEESKDAFAYADCMALCEPKQTTVQIECPTFENVNVYPPVDNCKLPENYLEKNTRPHMASLREYYLQKTNNWLCKKKKCDIANDEYQTCLRGCVPLYYSWTNQTENCTSLQHVLEARPCTEDSTECKKYKQCYRTKKEAWETVNTTVADEEESFLVEYRGLIRIRCLLEAFEDSIAGTKELDVGLEECRQTSYNNATYLGDLYIDYYDITQNPFKNCSLPTDVDAMPGSDEWINHFYSDMPDYTTYEACGASCCTSCNNSCPVTIQTADVTSLLGPMTGNTYDENDASCGEVVVDQDPQNIPNTSNTSQNGQAGTPS